MILKISSNVIGFLEYSNRWNFSRRVFLGNLDDLWNNLGAGANPAICQVYNLMYTSKTHILRTFNLEVLIFFNLT